MNEEKDYTGYKDEIVKQLAAILGVDSKIFNIHPKPDGKLLSLSFVADERVDTVVLKRIHDANFNDYKRESVTNETNVSYGNNKRYNFNFDDNIGTLTKLKDHAITGTVTRLAEAHKAFEKEITALSTPATISSNMEKALQKLSDARVNFSELAATQQKSGLQKK